MTLAGTTYHRPNTRPTCRLASDASHCGAPCTKLRLAEPPPPDARALVSAAVIVKDREQDAAVAAIHRVHGTDRSPSKPSLGPRAFAPSRLLLPAALHPVYWAPVYSG